MVGERFDASSEGPSADRGGAEDQRVYVGVHFACCNVYARAYVNRMGTYFVGYCPRCARRVAMRIDPDGSEDRFFTAY